jgi:hypothetical protein
MTFGRDATGFIPFGKEACFMPDSQISDADDNSDASTANRVHNKPIPQENQLPPQGLKIPDHFLVEQARITDLICVVLIVSLIAASAVTFCYTRSLLSFGFLTFLSLPLSIRRRKEEAIFPIGSEDFQIKLKELDVEMARIKNQNAPIILPLFTWFKRILKR